MPIRDVVAVLAAPLVLVTSVAGAQRVPYDGSTTQLATFAAEYEQARSRGGVASPDQIEDIGYYKGFVSGVFVSHTWTCVSSPIALEQVWAVVAKYLRENPERWDLRARDIVLEAAVHVWGCKSSK